EVERLRIVQIEGVDAAACAGIHVSTTGEVGLIKYDGLEKIRGRLRLHWLIGERAYRDTRDKDRLIAAMNRELTCGTEDVLASVQELKNRLRERDQRVSQLERTLAEQLVQSLLDGAERRGEARLVCRSFAAEDPSFGQTVFQKLLDLPATVACILCRRQTDFQWWIGCSADLDMPWDRVLPPLFPLIRGKGGGRGRAWQGIGRDPEGEARFLEALREAVWNQISGGTNG
ncbi:MAG: hypothetical protein JXB06_01270, partial [Spirochaetales bacterium]|nr:hypothetical protein [Spirochaetales bacterium]